MTTICCESEIRRVSKTRAAGGGRKSLSPAEKTTSRNVTLLPSQVTELERMGDGNLSAGIRRMYEMIAGTGAVMDARNVELRKQEN